MNREEAEKLLIKYQAGQCTNEEKAFLNDWYLHYNEFPLNISENRIEQIGEEIFVGLPVQRKRPTMKLIFKLSSAAAILALAIGSWYFISKSQMDEVTTNAQEILPGGNKATLTLDNGEMVELIGDKTGIVVTDNSVSYLDGQIAHKKSDNRDAVMQTLSTPTGGQYHVVLPDGSKVWLNSASSIRYPVSFLGKKERQVILTGEAYFEVQKMEKIPFIVSTENVMENKPKQQVEVLGTQFNVSSYNDMNVKTTLVEGSVRVSVPNGNKVRLSPGDQSVLSDKRLKVKQVDTDIEIAWKNGKTAFESADIVSVMSMLARWYDIEVIYEGKLSTAKFSGSVSRSKNISEVLKLLESTQEVHFKTKGREITVMN
ncbi:MAG: DUF4974 domain-containing protein [Flavobacterium sp.]|nr:MAG: DUF4974 domain-containing protein [Flavobacterium sp.]